MLERLHHLQLEVSEEKSFTNNIRPFAHLGNSDGESSLKFKKGKCLNEGLLFIFIWYTFCVIHLF